MEIKAFRCNCCGITVTPDLFEKSGWVVLSFALGDAHVCDNCASSIATIVNLRKVTNEALSN